MSIITYIVRQIEAQGYTVQAVRDGDDVVFEAVSKATGEVFAVKADAGDDYLAVCELAKLVGVDLAAG